MIEAVTRYVTKDGQEFKELDSARKYVADQVREYLDNKTKHLLNQGTMSAWDQYKMICSIIGDYTDVVELYNFLDKHI